jgi:hypothetical protein
MERGEGEVGVNGPEEIERARDSGPPRRWRCAGVEKVGRKPGAWGRLNPVRNGPGEGGCEGYEGEGEAARPGEGEETTRFLGRSLRLSFPSTIGELSDECNPFGTITLFPSSSLLDFRLWMFDMLHRARTAKALCFEEAWLLQESQS